MAILTVNHKPSVWKTPDGKEVTIPSSEQMKKYGPRVQISISALAAVAQQMVATGKQVPPPITGMALIDTGASQTCIDEAVAQKLALPIVNRAKITSASHAQVDCNIYPAQLNIVGFPVSMPCPLAIGAPLAVQGIIALIGRDILNKATLYYNGPTGQITLSF